MDAVDVIEQSDPSEKDKQIEKIKVFEARKLAFGTRFESFPPWSTNGKLLSVCFSQGCPVSRPLYT